MTGNEIQLAALKLMRHEIDASMATLIFRQQLGIGDDPDIVVTVAVRNFRRGLDMIDAWIDAYTKLIDQDRGQ